MSTQAATLSCRDVSLTIGRKTILDHASLELPLTGLTILRGQNGAGKTCFLRALLGLLPLQGGQILLNSQPPAQARRHCGYMPQRADDTAPMLPVLSHVMACLPGTFPPAAHPASRSQRGSSQSFLPHILPRWPFRRPGMARRAAEALLAETGALALAQHPLGVLSGGERQRVALAQALACHPSLLILDEPFAALDDQGHAALLALFSQLHGEKGINLLITAHGPLETDHLPMAVREVTLEGGQLHAHT